MSRAGTNTKNELVECAIKLIKEKGYDTTTIDEICEVAGITKGTFYYHFKSKEELTTFYFVSHMYQFDQTNIGSLNSILTAKNSWEQLLLVFEPMHELCISVGPEILLHIMNANLEIDIIPFQQSEDQRTDLITNLIRKGQEEGIFQSKRDHNELYKSIMYALKGVTLTWCRQNGSFSKSVEMKMVLMTILDVKED